MIDPLFLAVTHKYRVLKGLSSANTSIRGMRPEKVEQLNRMTKGLEKPDQETGSFAVYNVAERLRLYYGEAAGITFNSVYGEGTEATIRIPCMQEKNTPVPEEKGTGI